MSDEDYGYENYQEMKDAGEAYSSRLETKSTESGLDKQIEDMFQTEASVCEDCGHFAHEHYWNGGGNQFQSCYDQCKHEGCKCVSQNFKTKIIGYDESMVERVKSLTAQAVQEALEKQKDRYERLLGMDYKEAVKSIESEALAKQKKELVKKLEEKKIKHRLAKYDPITGISSDLYFFRYNEVIDLIKGGSNEGLR